MAVVAKGYFEVLNCSGSDGSEMRFEFLEGHFIGHKVRAEPWAYAADCCSDGTRLVTAEIVHVGDVPGFEAGKQVLCDIGQKAFAIDGPVEDASRCHLITTKGSNECQDFPMAVRHTALQTLGF